MAWYDAVLRPVANFIDRSVGNIPFVSNPYAPKPGKPAAPAYSPPPLPNINTSGAGDAAWMANLNNQIRALQNQIAQQPKLPKFDLVGNYNRARSQAEQHVNPLYNLKLNNFLADQQRLRGAKTQETEIRKEGINIERTGSLQENEVTRGRTVEDVQAALEKIGMTEDRFQRDEGTQFDAERREMARAAADSGLATSGIAAQQLGDAQNTRNVTSAEQVQEFGNQRAAKELFRTRTFEDMARGDTQIGKVADNKVRGAQFDLDSYIAELASKETDFRLMNELERGRDITNQTEAFRQQGIQQFIASLVGKARSQDIAYAAQVYR